MIPHFTFIGYPRGVNHSLRTGARRVLVCILIKSYGGASDLSLIDGGARDSSAVHDRLILLLVILIIINKN